MYRNIKDLRVKYFLKTEKRPAKADLSVREMNDVARISVLEEKVRQLASLITN